MRSFLRNRRFKNFAFKTGVLCSCLLLNSKAIYREIPFDNISLEEKYKSSLNGLSFCRTQSATDMPAKDALALLINVRSSAEWGMQYVLSSRGAIFTRKIADGVFSEWIQV